MVSRRAGLLDTSVVIDLDRIAARESLPAEPQISTITLAELTVRPFAATTELERGRRQQRLQFAEATFDPIPFLPAEARALAGVAASMRSSDRTSARAFDALIAAVALANDLPLYTRNPSEFAHIDGLDVHPVTLHA